VKILLLAPDAYGGHGGIALYLRELTLALTRVADHVTVIPRVVQTEIHDVPPNVTFVAEAAHGPLAYLNALRRARGADLVICGHVNLLPFACMLALRPLLVVYGIEVWQPTARRLSRPLLHHARAIISISEITRDRLLAWSGYRARTFIVPNSIHAEEYGIREKRPELVAKYGVEGKRVILTVGRLDAREQMKGFDEIINVLPSLPNDVVYLIAGGGDDAPRLQRRAMDAGVGSRVRFTGLFDASEKPDLYALADVYAMPSRGEGFGFVFLEAMACGVPVIGSKTDGGREALRDGELGTLVHPDDPEELRAAIVRSFAQPKRVPEGLDYFSFENFAERVSRAIRSAAGIERIS
jgi:phosphatidyl-myo-inositol dimannoside synthase